MLEFRGLGTVEVWCDGRKLPLGGTKQRGLLASLMLEPGRVVPLERLIDRLWPHRGAGRTTLYRLASRLRGVLADSGYDVLLSRTGGYLLAIDPDQVDIHRFERLVQDGRRELAAENVESASRLLAEALALWRGSALTGVPEAVRDGPATRLEELRVLAAEERIAADLALGRHEQLIPELNELVTEHPWREQLTGHLMTTLQRSGRRAEALEVYSRSRQRMVDELGLEPGSQLQRLQAHILAAEPDAQREATQPRQLPIDVPAFTGRADQLRHLDAIIDAAHPAAVVAISGMAGVGKTTLAVHWAHSAAAHFPDGQLYVDLRGFDPSGQVLSPAQAVRGFLDAFAVPPDRVPADPAAQFALFRTVVAGKRILALLDNARDTEHVRPLLGGGPGSLTIVTSRDQLAGLIAANGAYTIVLDPLDLNEGRELLTRRLGEGRTAAEPEATGDIIGLCAGLPLALAVVAARAATHRNHGLKVLAEELRSAHSRLDVLADATPGIDVRAVFSWSYDQLNVDAARLFRLLGLHPGPDISLLAAASLAGVPQRRARQLLAQLCRVHLANEHAPGRYRLHDLLRVYAAELAADLDTDSQRRMAVHRMLDYYLHTANAAAKLLNPHRCEAGIGAGSDATPALDAPLAGVTLGLPAKQEDALAWFSAEHPILLAAINDSAHAAFDASASKLAWAVDTFLDRRGHWNDLAATQRTALDASQRLDDRAGQARSHRGLARAYRQLGRSDDARAHLQSALDLHTQLGDHLGQANTHMAIAWVGEEQGRYREALSHALQALDHHHTIGHQVGQARLLNAVGWDYALLGHHRRALIYCRRALRQLQELDDRIGQAATWDSLGYAHHHLGQHARASTCYEHSLALFKELGDRYYEAIILSHLSDTQHATGHAAAAHNSRLRALAILEDLGHRDAEQVRAKLHRPPDLTNAKSPSQRAEMPVQRSR